MRFESAAPRSLFKFLAGCLVGAPPRLTPSSRPQTARANVWARSTGVGDGANGIVTGSTIHSHAVPRLLPAHNPTRPQCRLLVSLTARGQWLAR
jgi:hypothetical protein